MFEKNKKQILHPLPPKNGHFCVKICIKKSAFFIVQILKNLENFI